MLAVAALACRRSARISVQRLLPLVSEPRPSVIESPMMATAFDDAGAITSMPEMKYQWSVFPAEAIAAADTSVLPACTYDVVREPACAVRLLGTLPSAIVIVTFESGASAKSSGSDHTSMPCGMVTDAFPEKASALSVAVSIVLSASPVALQIATCA